MKTTYWYIHAVALFVLFMSVALSSCTSQTSSSPESQELARELIFYDWEEDLPQSVLDGFTEEFGVAITYLTYESQEEVVPNMQAGKVYDVVVLDNDRVPDALAKGLLAEIDYRNVPNFNNISASFRNLVYDPDNKHSIPFNWGTTGIIFRRDLVPEPVTTWQDVWALSEIGKIAVRDEPREMLGMALKVLGYSLNSEDPAQLQEAFGLVQELNGRLIVTDGYAEAVVPLLLNGDVIALVGWADDAIQAQEASEDLVYVLPKEGAMLWGDNFIIPSNSPRKYTAELFLNYLLRPEVSAEIVNQNNYANANEAIAPFVDAEILANPIIFPPNEQLVQAEVILPLSSESKALYIDLWEQLKAEGGS